MDNSSALSQSMDSVNTAAGEEEVRISFWHFIHSMIAAISQIFNSLELFIYVILSISFAIRLQFVEFQFQDAKL